MGIGKHFGWCLDRASEPKKEQNYSKFLWHLCQCAGSSQIPSQDDFNYHQFLSLYKLMRKDDRTELTIYDTKSGKKKTKLLSADIVLDDLACITQLPNGELFCYGSYESGITLIIDRSYGVRMLPSGTPSQQTSALYFENSIYCSGGHHDNVSVDLIRKFDLEKNIWINLARIPDNDFYCHSMIFNRNILISGYFGSLLLYSPEIESFSMIPYEFKTEARKLLINVQRLYLIEWHRDGLIYEGEDEYNWKPISKSEILSDIYLQMYCLYYKEKVYISTNSFYNYQFDLKKKVISKIN